MHEKYWTKGVSDTYEERSCSHPKEGHQRPLTPAQGQS